ncbi:hypothetical protein GCM10029992_00040 [Glycomyces albus]
MTTSQQSEAVGRLTFTYLPDGLGQQSDFEFEGGVKFAQRVWESQIEAGVWRVDLQVQVMRGEALGDKKSMREFLIRYHEKDDDWLTAPFGDDGYAGDREIAMLVESGMAAEVKDPSTARTEVNWSA